MTPHYLWLTDAVQLLTFFVIGPLIAIAIAYAIWQRRQQNFALKRYRTMCIVSCGAAILLLVFAKWMNADVRTPQYFLQLAALLIGGLLFGVGMGSSLTVLLGLWNWHKMTRLTSNNS